jgi:hypothetical protein
MRPFGSRSLLAVAVAAVAAAAHALENFLWKAEWPRQELFYLTSKVLLLKTGI